MAEQEILIAYFSHPGQNYVNGDIVVQPIGNVSDDLLEALLRADTQFPFFHERPEKL